LAAFFAASIPELFHLESLVAAIIFFLVLPYAGSFYLIFERNTDHIRRFVEGCFLHRRGAGPALASMS
jgi:hypothetical protein